jgi:hypothetical protein
LLKMGTTRVRIEVISLPDGTVPGSAS